MDESSTEFQPSESTSESETGTERSQKTVSVLDRLKCLTPSTLS